MMKNKEFKLSEKEWNNMVTKYGQQLQDLENELLESKNTIKILENLQLKEKEKDIVYYLYPKLKKKVLEFEKKRRSDDEIWIQLKRFIKRNNISGEVHVISLLKRLEELMKRVGKDKLNIAKSD